MEINVELMYCRLLELGCHVLRGLLEILMTMNIDLMHNNLLRLVCHDIYEEHSLREEMHPPLSEAQLEFSDGWDSPYQMKPDSRWRPKMDAPIGYQMHVAAICLWAPDGLHISIVSREHDFYLIKYHYQYKN